MTRILGLVALLTLISPVVSAEVIVNSEDWRHHAVGAAIAEVEGEEYYGVDEPGEVSILNAKELENPVVYKSSKPGFSGLARTISSQKRSIPDDWASKYAENRSLTSVKVSDRFAYQAATAMPVVSKGLFPVFSGPADRDWSSSFRRPSELSVHVYNKYFEDATAASVYDSDEIGFDSLTGPRPVFPSNTRPENLRDLGVNSALFFSQDLLPLASDAEDVGVESVVQVGRAVVGTESTSFPPNAVQVPERTVDLTVSEEARPGARALILVRNTGNAQAKVNVSTEVNGRTETLYTGLAVPPDETLTVPLDTSASSSQPVVARYGERLEISGDGVPESPPTAVSFSDGRLIASNPGTETTYLTVRKDNKTRVLGVPPSTTESFPVQEPDFVAGSSGIRRVEASNGSRALVTISVVSVAILFGLLLWGQVDPRFLSWRGER